MRAVNKRNVTVMLLIVLLAVLAIERQMRPSPEPESVAVLQQQPQTAPLQSGAGAGLLAPSFTLQGTEGTVYKVGGPREKALILNFWASWCEPCRLEAPELNELAHKYKDVLDIYGVNVTSQDYKPNAERFIRKYMLAFPVMFDMKGEVFDKYNGAVFPTNVLIDKNGVISEIVLGVLSREELEKKIITLTGS